MRRLPVLMLSAALALGLAACGDDEEPSAGATEPAPVQEQPASDLPEGCRAVDAPEPKGEQSLKAPSRRLAAGRAWTVTLRTNCGAIDIRLDTERAPKTAASFAALVRDGFYDGLTFHRIAGGPSGEPFVIQGGDPRGDGTGGPGYSVVEAPPQDLAYTRGVVAMAKTQDEAPGTSGSQFYIVTGQDAGLPPEYALVGEIADGDDVVARIAQVPADEAERPLSPVVIERATLAGG